jgi:hypothetical protein
MAAEEVKYSIPDVRVQVYRVCHVNIGKLVGNME